jgi:hypothetical protein
MMCQCGAEFCYKCGSLRKHNSPACPCILQPSVLLRYQGIHAPVQNLHEVPTISSPRRPASKAARGPRTRRASATRKAKDLPGAPNESGPGPRTPPEEIYRWLGGHRSAAGKDHGGGRHPQPGSTDTRRNHQLVVDAVHRFPPFSQASNAPTQPVDSDRAGRSTPKTTRFAPRTFYPNSRPIFGSPSAPQPPLILPEQSVMGHLGGADMQGEPHLHAAKHQMNAPDGQAVFMTSTSQAPVPVNGDYMDMSRALAQSHRSRETGRKRGR